MVAFKRPKGSKPVIKYTESHCPIKGLEGNCHIFEGAKFKGYGRIWYGRNMPLHRYVWEQSHGPMPLNMVIDHQCRRRDCCNVNHLRMVTRKVNSTENIEGHPWQIGKAMTHCKRGHEFTTSNARFDRRGCRQCRQCEKERYRRRR